MLLQKIRSIASEKGLSICSIEKMAGLSQNSIPKWDRVEPSVFKVKTVADILGVTLDELMKEEEE